MTNNIDKIIKDSRSDFDNAIRIPKETHYTNRISKCQSILRKALTSHTLAIRKELEESIKMDGVYNCSECQAFSCWDTEHERKNTELSQELKQILNLDILKP